MWDGRGDFSCAAIPHGPVVDTDNLFIADASVMPEVSRTNINIPTIMIAERIAEMVCQR